MINRDFSGSEQFVPFNPSMEPPVVGVMGLSDEILGVGRWLGNLRGRYGNDAVISVEDPNSPAGRVELLGSECRWQLVDGASDEILDLLMDPGAQSATTSASEYVRSLMPESRLSLSSLASYLRRARGRFHMIRR
jgi:hypothetical protein